jgi:hypothetical protein
MSSFSGKPYTLRICCCAVNVADRTLGSSSRAFGIVWVSLRSSAWAASVSTFVPVVSCA